LNPNVSNFFADLNTFLVINRMNSTDIEVWIMGASLTLTDIWIIDSFLNILVMFPTYLLMSQNENVCEYSCIKIIEKSAA